MKYIPLTQNKSAIVDDADFERLSEYKWQYSSQGYAVHSTSRKLGKQTKLRMHRLVMNARKGDFIDHKNRDRLDNRKENLRIATISQNISNSKLHSSNKSGYKGVCWHSRDKTWVAYICKNGKRFHLGNFSDPHTASKVRDKAAKKYHGEFAALNI